MPESKQKVRLPKSSVVGKTPNVNIMDFGELYVNYASGTGNSFLVTKKFDGTLAKFPESASVVSALNTKVDKVSGKDLSTNDFTTTLKNKLEGIASGAQVNVQSDWNATSGDALILNKPTIPTTTSQLTNDSGFITVSGVPQELFKCNMSSQLVDGHLVYSCDKTWSEIYAAHQSGKLVLLSFNTGYDLIFTPTMIYSGGGSFDSARYSYLEGVGTVYYTYNFTYNPNTNEWKFTNSGGLEFSPSYKEKLDSIESGAQVNVQSDWDQNNSASTDYIKNRTHYREYVEGDDIRTVFNANFSESNSGDYYYGNIYSNKSDIKPDSFYDVVLTINNVDYTYDNIVSRQDGNDVVLTYNCYSYDGNNWDKFNLGVDTNDSGLYLLLSTSAYSLTGDNISVGVNIKELVIGGSVYDFNESGLIYVAGMSSGLTRLEYEGTTSFDPSGEYKIKIDNVEYTREAQYTDAYAGLPIYVFGNGKFLNALSNGEFDFGLPDNGDNFCVAFIDGTNLGAPYNIVYMILRNANYTSSASSTTVKVYKYGGYEYHKLDNRYLDLENSNAFAKVAFSGDYSDLENTPYIPESLGNLTDISFGYITSGQVLQYNGSEWVNGTLPSIPDVSNFITSAATAMTYFATSANVVTALNAKTSVLKCTEYYSGGIRVDKSISEIIAAYNEGKYVYIESESTYTPLSPLFMIDESTNTVWFGTLNVNESAAHNMQDATLYATYYKGTVINGVDSWSANGINYASLSNYQNVQPSWTSTSGWSQILNKPTKLSDFTNDGVFIDSAVTALKNFATSSDTVTALNGKQATISDLAKIRSDAASGYSAYQTLTGHVTSASHITAAERTAWNNKIDSGVTAMTNYATSANVVTALSGKTSQTIDVTYSELVQLKNNSALIPGQSYRITDYATTTVQDDTRAYILFSFKPIVVAKTNNKLNNCAIADDNYNFQIWYDIENNTSKYSWADSTNGKGVIYRMIDLNGNDCPYDFYNIQFKRKIGSNSTYDPINGTDTWVYTFTRIVGNYVQNAASLADNRCRGNVIKKYSGNQYVATLNNIVMIGNDCCNNTFGYDCYNNTLGTYCFNNIFGNGCKNNTLGFNCFNNIFGNYCSNNEITGSNSTSNIFGNSCTDNKIEGSSSSLNTFGNNCCYIIMHGDLCTHNSFGTDCQRITFGDENGQYGSYIKDVVVGNGSNNIRLYEDGTADINHKLQYVYISQGMTGGFPNYLNISTIPRGLAYATKVARNSNGVLKIYNEADLVL